VDIGKIDGVNEPSLNQPRQEDRRGRRAEEARRADDVNISPEARKAAELARLVSLAKEILDVRDDKIAEAAKRLETEDASDELVNRTVAQRMLEDLL
jgi:hypothetical protein